MTTETIGFTVRNLTEEAAASFSRTTVSPRLATILALLVKHLHGFIREAEVTPEEWAEGIQFLTACGDITSEKRNEFALLSDILGVSSLVDLLPNPPGATPGSLLGPFYNPDSIEYQTTADLFQGQPGVPTLFHGRVLDAAGNGVAHALVDFWQNADNGYYPAADPEQDEQNLRGKIRCDASGYFAIKTIRPKAYSVPMDGPVGHVLDQLNKLPWRPAHWHVIVSAPGYRSITTELFPDDDEYINTDPVFSIRPGLALTFKSLNDEASGKQWGLPIPFCLVDFDFHLVAEQQG